jgi:hypothetical protein
MAQWNQGTGTGGNLQLQITEVGYNAAGNYSTVHVNAQIYTPPGSFHSDANLSVSLSGIWSTGSWSFGSGGGWHTLYDGVVTIGHNADGTGSFGTTFALNSYTGTSGVGGPSSVYGAIGLTTLTVAPGTPDGLVATRNSDSQITLTWNNHYASNGVPTATNVAQSVNGAAYATVVSSGNISSSSIASAANRKTTFLVSQGNGAGWSANSAASAPVWTTPGAPSSCAATKQSDGSILVSWTNNVAYAEYATEVWHGTVSGGTTTWDATPLATAAAGVTSQSDAAPDVTKVHVYQVRSKTTSGTVLYSGYSTSNSVQLLVAPNAPTVASLAQYADKAVALTINWTHNPIDSTAETAYEVSRSTDGGSTWTTTGKTAGSATSFTVAASTYAANTALTVRVRTWGQATTGGSDGAGGSPWSALQTVTFKTKPTLSITAPTSAGITIANLLVTLAFAQAEGATFVSAALTLLQGATVLETVNTTTPSNIPFNTQLQNATTYTVQAVATGSNGLQTAQASVTFLVTYSPPAPGTIAPTYVAQDGMAQLVLTFPAPVSPQVAAATYTLTRTIAGIVETVVSNAAVPGGGSIALLDTTPTIHGDNLYTLITYSSLGASATVTADMPTSETQWAFLSTGQGFASYVAFYGDLAMGSTPQRDSALFLAAGRSRPIALFGSISTLDIDVAATLLADEGSTPAQVEAFLLTAGRACFRDPSGRRVFGMISGSKIANLTPSKADLTFTISEAS